MSSSAKARRTASRCCGVRQQGGRRAAVELAAPLARQWDDWTLLHVKRDDSNFVRTVNKLLFDLLPLLTAVQLRLLVMSELEPIGDFVEPQSPALRALATDGLRVRRRSEGGGCGKGFGPPARFVLGRAKALA
ncbi:hypothetical protein THAOC_37920 [Thalassiosira oceanica]|uniref:Uncharacterized protein n=1 Tax=Thalassiosira oceanica TaxID=159749 RepID=K0RAU1_THAOC|nr:hypothetical protein THAOC_37920 [Thalassiosira oceanica]|eukprot:EJK43617.1 hypothetical protein THAOC_37920 [Thalassiosira oceanica]